LALLDPSFESVALCRGTGPVEIRATSDGRVQASLPPSTNLPAYVAWWSADSKYLAVKRDHDPGGQVADLEVWEMREQRRILLLPGMSHNAACFHPRQHRLLVAQVDGGIGTWDLDQGRQVSQSRLPAEPIRLQYAPDGERFAVAYESETNSVLAVHDAATSAEQILHRFPDPVLNFDWAPGGHWLAVASLGAAVYLMDPQNGEVCALGNHKAQAVTVTFSPDGQYLFSGGWEGELICWDMRTRTRSFNIGRQSWTLQFRSDGQKCALINRAGIQFYEFEQPKYRQFAEDLGPRLLHAAFSSDGRWLAASADQYLGVWDLKREGPGALMSEVSEARPAFTPDGRYLWASGSGDTCTGWRLLPGKTSDSPPKLRALNPAQPDGFSSIAVASNLVVVSGSKGSQVIDPERSWSKVDRWIPTPTGITGASADGQWLGIYASFTPSLFIYKLPGFERVAKLNSQDNIRDFVYSPFGAEVAVSSGGAVAFWSTRSWTQTRVLTDFSAILFSPDSSAYWLTKDYRNAGLYDARTLALLLPLPTGTLPLTLSSDGRYLAVSVESRHLQVWDLDEVREQLAKLGLSADIGSQAPHISQR
jgi:WD40 repeat protein